VPGEFAGCDDGAAKLRGDFLKTRGKIDRGADAGEIEPAACPGLGIELLFVRGRLVRPKTA